MSLYDEQHPDDTAVQRAARTPDTGDGRRAGRVETRDFSRTSEFWMVVVVGVAILIAGSVVGANGDDADVFRADKVWLYLTILAAAYVVSRGMAKSGAAATETDRHLRHGGRPDRAPLADRVKAAAQVLTDGPGDRSAARGHDTRPGHDDPDTVATPPRR